METVRTSFTQNRPVLVMNGRTSIFLFPQQVKFSLEKGFGKRGGGGGRGSNVCFYVSSLW